MRDYIDLGSTPFEEDCAQVGTTNYGARAQKECRRFIEQLRRQHGPEPDGARLRVKANPHDFGTYYSVVCDFDPDRPESQRYAFDLEANLPARWDEEDDPTAVPSENPRPSMDDLERMMFSGRAEATDGCIVEPDGQCPHGKPSWLRKMGLI